MKLPAKHYFSNVEGNEIFVREKGQGESVILLHGFPDSGKVWDKVIDAIATNFRCYAIDLPGLGQSKLAKHFNFQLSHLSHLLKIFIEQNKITLPIHLIVHDLGAFTGLAYCSDHPKCIKSLSIFNSDFHSDFQWYFWAKIWRIPILGEIAMFASTYSTFKKEMQKGSTKFTDTYLQELYKDLSFYNRRMALKHFRGWNRKNLEIYEKKYAENTIAIPKKVFWGKQDPYSPVDYAERFGTDNVVYSDTAGHWFMIDEAELTISELKKFLTGPMTIHHSAEVM